MQVLVCTRRFSTFQPKAFHWTPPNSPPISTEFSFLPVSAQAPTIILVASLTLASSKEEWRPVARILHESGFNSAILELPGFALTQGALNAAFLGQDRPIDAWHSYLSQFFEFIRLNTAGQPLLVVTAGGQTSALAANVLQTLPTENFRHICIAPKARQYLRDSTAAGFERRFLRKQRRTYKLLTEYLGPWNFFQRMYLSPWFLRRHGRALYESDIPSDRLIAQQLALRRPGVDLNFQAALYCGYLDAATSADALTKTLLFLEDESTEEQGAFDTDEEDDIVFSARPLPLIQKPKFEFWRPTPKTRNARLILSDSSDLKLAAEKFAVPVASVPGRLHCHEEFPAAVAEAIVSLVRT